jgi:hypothetical protein
MATMNDWSKTVANFRAQNQHSKDQFNTCGLSGMESAGNSSFQVELTLVTSAARDTLQPDLFYFIFL